MSQFTNEQLNQLRSEVISGGVASHAKNGGVGGGGRGGGGEGGEREGGRGSLTPPG